MWRTEKVSICCKKKNLKAPSLFPGSVFDQRFRAAAVYCPDFSSLLCFLVLNSPHMHVSKCCSGPFWGQKKNRMLQTVQRVIAAEGSVYFKIIIGALSFEPVLKAVCPLLLHDLPQ